MWDVLSDTEMSVGGAMVLQRLRETLGDAVFFAVLRLDEPVPARPGHHSRLRRHRQHRLRP